MGRKNTFLPKNLKKSKLFKELKFSDKIEWYPEGTTLEDYIKDLLTNFPIKSVDDIGELTNYKDYLMIGKYEINSNLKVDSDIFNYMYLICDPEYKTISFSIETNYPLFWYTYETRKELNEAFDMLYEAYNPKEYNLNFEKNCRGFIGTDDALEGDIDYITNQFIINPDSECLFWGSKWRDYPFRSLFNGKVSHKQILMMSSQAMKQSDGAPFKLNVRSKFSKSIITIEDYKGIYIANVKYNPIEYKGIKKIVTNNKDRDYPIDLPIDVITSMMLYPFLSHKSILKLDKLTNYNFYIATLIANTKNMNKELVQITNEIIKENKENDSIKKICENFLKTHKFNMEVDELFTDKSVTTYIEKKIANIQNDVQTFDQVKDDIYKEIENRIENLKQGDNESKEQMTKIINNILVTNLSLNR